MDLGKKIDEINLLTKDQIKKRAKANAVEILNEFTNIYKTTDLFEKHNLMPWELLLRLSYAAIAGDNKININEYELFVEMTEGLIDKPTPKKLADEILAVAGSPALRKTLQKNVKLEYRKISWNQVAKKCLRIYNKNMKHKGFN